jgi:hypothetical protein
MSVEEVTGEKQRAWPNRNLYTTRPLRAGAPARPKREGKWQMLYARYVHLTFKVIKVELFSIR